VLQVTYQKRNGVIFKRLRDTTPPYRVGEETSMGWKVLNIEYEYNNKFYPSYEYYKLIDKHKQKIIRHNQLKKKCKKVLISLLNSLIGFIIINLINI
jgi:hypothetical protein